MDYMLHLAHPFIFLGAVVIIVACGFFRWFYYRSVVYNYSLVSFFAAQGYHTSSLYKSVPFVFRALVLLFLALLMSRPQWVDIKSKINVEGIDIMMVLDASGSMQCFDDLADQRSRFLVAKTEAINFIEKRENDQIGLVLFGRDAISRCPLTLDRKILKQILQDTELGSVSPNGTALSIAIAMAARRLKDSKAKSKIMIVLTDGEPTREIDIDPLKALDIVKKLGIKIYTIGIGGDHGGLIRQEPFGIVAMHFAYNKNLLKMFAHETGGNFFEAKNPSDMEHIYRVINELEKTEYETNIFTHYLDIIFPFICIICALLLLELISAFVWFTL